MSKEALTQNSDIPIDTFVQIREFKNDYELGEIMNSFVDVKLQAILICKRILGATHLDTVYHIRHLGIFMGNLGNYQKCIQLWLYALGI